MQEVKMYCRWAWNCCRPDGGKGRGVKTVKYVVGFLISNHSDVALIRKQRPEWQRGFLNGIGGHIEKGESAHDAMRREFEEETGNNLTGWHEFISVRGIGYELHYFSAHIPSRMRLKKTTDEKPGWFNIQAILKQGKILANLHWLIPMANYKFKLRGEIIHDNPEC